MSESSSPAEIVIIGSGIMSAKLAVLLKQLDPTNRITVYEAAEELSPEASHGWHNAGTGHAGICELSYTPDLEADGTVDVTKAIDIFAEFEQSLQFWAHAVHSGIIKDRRARRSPLFLIDGLLDGSLEDRCLGSPADRVPRRRTYRRHPHDRRHRR